MRHRYVIAQSVPANNAEGLEASQNPNWEPVICSDFSIEMLMAKEDANDDDDDDDDICRIAV